jgi:hypothetical protein
MRRNSDGIHESSFQLPFRHVQVLQHVPSADRLNLVTNQLKASCHGPIRGSSTTDSGAQELTQKDELLLLAGCVQQLLVEIAARQIRQCNGRVRPAPRVGCSIVC